MGLKGKDFVVVCSDTVAAQSIIRMKADEEKIIPIDDHKLFVLSGKALHNAGFSLAEYSSSCVAY